MIQEVIVGIIGVAILTLLLYRTYTFFFTKKDERKGSCGCASCHCNISKK